MEIVSCTRCHYRFTPYDSDSDFFVECPKCGARFRYFTGVEEYERYRDNLDYTIDCGILRAYHQNERYINLPDIITIIEDGYKDDGTHWPYSSCERRHGVFEGCDVEEVRLSQNIRQLGDYAFAECELLKKVVIPEGLVTIGTAAFMNCTSLEEIVIPATCKEIGNSAFRGCKNLRHVEVRGNSNSINDKCFMLEERAFYGCEKLRHIELPNSIWMIPAACFYGCASLESFDMPSNIRSIKEHAFEGCESIRQLKFPTSNKSHSDDGDWLSFGERCFYGMKSLSYINIPDFTYMGQESFGDNPSLTNVEIADELLAKVYYKFRNTAFQEKAKIKLIRNFSVNNRELDGIKEELDSIFKKKRLLNQKLSNLGMFDLGVKRELKSKLSNLVSKERSLLDRGYDLEKEARKEIEGLCRHYSVAFIDGYYKDLSDYRKGNLSSRSYFEFISLCEWMRNH